MDTTVCQAHATPATRVRLLFAFPQCDNIHSKTHDNIHDKSHVITKAQRGMRK